jgi:hypothetical protein
VQAVKEGKQCYVSSRTGRVLRASHTDYHWDRFRSYLVRSPCLMCCVMYCVMCCVMCCIVSFYNVPWCSDTSIGVVGFVTHTSIGVVGFVTRSRIREEL